MRRQYMKPAAMAAGVQAGVGLSDPDQNGGRDPVPVTPSPVIEIMEKEAAEQWEKLRSDSEMIHDFLHWVISDRGRGPCNPKAWSERVGAIAMVCPQSLLGNKTQAKLARELGVSQSKISRWTKPKHRPWVMSLKLQKKIRPDA